MEASNTAGILKTFLQEVLDLTHFCAGRTRAFLLSSGVVAWSHMLTEYLRAAMGRAHYELLDEGEGFYGEIPGFQSVYAQAGSLEICREELAKLTLADVNRVLRRHLKSDCLRIVMVTKDAEGLRRDLIDGQPSPIQYNSPKPQEILDEDKRLESYPLRVKPDAVRVVPVQGVFE